MKTCQTKPAVRHFPCCKATQPHGLVFHNVRRDSGPGTSCSQWEREVGKCNAMADHTHLSIMQGPISPHGLTCPFIVPSSSIYIVRFTPAPHFLYSIQLSHHMPFHFIFVSYLFHPNPCVISSFSHFIFLIPSHQNLIPTFFVNW